MNWKLCVFLSILGLLVGMVTISIVPSTIEPFLWLGVFLITAVLTAKYAPGKYFVHGFLISILNSIWVTLAHERDNAAAEVRRSFSGDYGPLYQIAYMMGGLQFYSLHHDLVDSKKMTNKQFHDAILHEGPIPVEMVRAILTNQKLNRDQQPSWRYYSLQ